MHAYTFMHTHDIRWHTIHKELTEFTTNSERRKENGYLNPDEEKPVESGPHYITYLEKYVFQAEK